MNNETELMDPVTPSQALELIEQLRATEYNKMAKDSFESYRNYKNANEAECELIQDEWLEKWIDYTKHNTEFKGKEKSKELKRVFKAWIHSCSKWLDNASFSQLSLHKVDSEAELVESVKKGISDKDQQYIDEFLFAQTSDEYWYNHMRSYKTKKCAKVHDGWNEQWKLCWAKKCVDFEFNVDSTIDLDAKIFSEVHDIWENYAHQSAWTDWTSSRSFQNNFFEWSRALKSKGSKPFHMREMIQNERIGICDTNEKYQKLINFLYDTPFSQIFSHIYKKSSKLSNNIRPESRSDCIPISCNTLFDEEDFLEIMRIYPNVEFFNMDAPKAINSLFEREFFNITITLTPGPGYSNFDIVKNFISELSFPYSGTFATQLFYKYKDRTFWHSVILFTRAVVDPTTLNVKLVEFTILDQQQYDKKIRLIENEAIDVYLNLCDSIIISVFGMNLYTYPKLLNYYMRSTNNNQYRGRSTPRISRKMARNYKQVTVSQPRSPAEQKLPHRSRSRSRGGFIASNKVLKYKNKGYKTKRYKK